jgi:hypothetical protein
MKTIYEVLEIISLICKMVLMIYSGWKFFAEIVIKIPCF